MTSTLLNLAGHPARESLLAYRRVDLLKLHIVPTDMSISNSITAVPLQHVLSKAVFISAFGLSCCIKQPNNNSLYFLCNVNLFLMTLFFLLLL